MCASVAFKVQQKPDETTTQQRAYLYVKRDTMPAWMGFADFNCPRQGRIRSFDPSTVGATVRRL